VDRDDARSLSTYSKLLRQHSDELRARAQEQFWVADALLETIRASLEILAAHPPCDLDSSALIGVGLASAYQVPRVLPLEHAGSTGPGVWTVSAAVAGDRRKGA
jgi:hypothetical protein